MNIQFPQWFFSKEPGRGTSASANLRRFGSVCSRGRAARHTTMASAMNVPLGADDAWWKSKDWCLCHDLQKAFGARMYTTFWTWDNLILVWTLNWDYWYVLLMFLHQRTKGSLFRKFPSYGRMSKGSLIIIIIIIILILILIIIFIIMSSSCQQHKKQEGRRSRMSVSAQVDVGKLSTKSVPNCGESRMCTSKCWKTEQPVLHGRVRTVDAARNLVDLLRCSCYAGLQAAVTNRIDTAARSKVWVMLRQSCYSSLQLEVAHSFMHSFHFISFHFISFIHCIHSWIDSFIPSFIPSFVHAFVNSSFHACMHALVYLLIHSFIQSFLPSFMHSFIHAFLHSFILAFTRSFRHAFFHWFVPSLIHSFIPSCAQSLICSFIHSLRLACSHWFLPSFIDSFMHSFNPSFIPSFFHSFIPSM